MTTQVKITKIGENFMLPLSAELLEKLEISNGGSVEVTTSGNSVVLRPSTNGVDRKQEFQELKNRIFDEYDDVFTALAEGAK